MRDTFNSAARPLVDGTRCPGLSWPSRMALRNHSYNCRYIGIFFLESSVIGGRKLAEIRFIGAGPNPAKVAISYHARVAIVAGHLRS